MSEASLDQQFRRKTAAGLAGAVVQRHLANYGVLTAVTTAAPPFSTSALVRIAYDQSKAPESVSWEGDYAPAHKPLFSDLLVTAARG